MSIRVFHGVCVGFLLVVTSVAQTANEIGTLPNGGAAVAGHGASVAIDGDTAVVGAPFENGGVVRAYVRSSPGWSQQAALSIAGTVSFGSSVDVDIDTLVVGEPFFNSSSGRVHVFTRSAGNWTLQATLQAPAPTAGDAFGVAVSVRGDVIAVGASGRDMGALLDTGAVLLFVRTGTAWSFTAEAHGWGVDQANHGAALDLHDGRLLVGSPREYSNTGAFYDYRLSGGSIVTMARWAGTPGSRLGTAVALDGQNAVVSALTDAGGLGRVYLFAVEQNSLGLFGSFDGAQPNSDFGASVAVSSGKVLVGAPNAGSGGPGFVREFVCSNLPQGPWFEAFDLAPSGNQAGAEFGTVALDDDTAIIGAPFWLSPGPSEGAAFAFGLAGKPFGFCASGSPCANDYATGGCAYSTTTGLGGRLLGWGSSSVASDDLRLVGYQLNANTSGILVLSATGQAPFVSGNGLSVLCSPSHRFALTPATNGVIDYGPGLVALTFQRFGIAITPGQTWHYQMWFRNPAGPCTGEVHNWTNGYAVTYSN
ncbi:MAG: hypothetical protein HZA52_11025 [Planctomycetes bacterium]|nr:hypothetical protein [Planctomycetota bacterium]